MNNTLNTIRDFIWQITVSDTAISHTSSHVILIKFNKLLNESDVSVNADGRHYISIFAATREFIKDSELCERTQFPLTLSYVITVHKSQKIIVDKTILNISSKEFTARLSYVTVSRVKKFNELLFI